MISLSTFGGAGAPWLRRALLAVPVAVLIMAAPAQAGNPGDLDAGFDPNADDVVQSIALQPDGKIVIGGVFTQVGGVTRNYVARLNPDGTLDTTFNPNPNGSVDAIALQADGKIVIGGGFTQVSGQTRNRLARLNPDGTLDATFDPSANLGTNAIAVQGDGKVLVGGYFTQVDGETRNRVARLNTDGSLDATFNPNVNSLFVGSIALQGDGKIVIGGNFTTVGGVFRHRVARLNSDGTLDTSLANPFVSSMFGAPTVYSVVPQENGKVLIGGAFDQVNGLTRNRVARLGADGTPDSFNPNANATVNSVALQSDGKIVIGGVFTQVGGGTRSGIARLNPDGSLDTSFVDSNVNSSVYTAALQADGKAVIVGEFTQVGGQTRGYVARVLATFPQAAPSSVTAVAGDAQAAVSWRAVPGEISNYTVTASPGGRSCTSTTTGCSVTGLTNGTPYTFTVRAANEFGSGPASSPSNSVSPTAPTASMNVASPKAKVTRNSVLVSSKVRVSGAGKIAQRATTKKGKKTRTWCRTSKTAANAGTHTLNCNLGKTGRTALRKATLKLTLRTTFTPTGGSAVAANRKLTLKRKR